MKRLIKLTQYYSIIHRHFRYITSDSLVLLYKSLVRSVLEYGNCVWSPYRQLDIEKLEKVQKRATKMVSQLSNYSYEDRLRCLNLPTLKYRRIRRDMIQVFNIICGLHHDDSVVKFEMHVNICNTRRNMYKIQQSHSHYDLRKHFFTNRIINIWNSLPNNIVTATSTNIFKNRLDKFWLIKRLNLTGRRT